MTDPLQGVQRTDKIGTIQPAHTTSVGNTAGAQFDKVLQGEVSRQQEVKFSHHALDRLRARNIHLTSHDVNQLNGAVQQVADKGGQDSLVLMNNVAYLINVPSRTVITAIENAQMQENVFTQIDSAVIV
jgi:flagellar operon protein